MHERQVARMRNRSEWFLSGVDRVDSLDMSSDMHLRPPIGHPGMGTYRSQDDLTRYRNDDLITFEFFCFFFLLISFYAKRFPFFVHVNCIVPFCYFLNALFSL